MQIEIFTICDSAQSYGNKLVIVGTFNQFISNSFPLTYMQTFSVVGRITYEDEELGLKEVLVTITNSEGKNIINPLPLSMNIEKSSGGMGGSLNFNCIVNNITFEQPGLYYVNLATQEESRQIKLFVLNE